MRAERFAQVKRLVDEATDLPAEHREAYLDEACRGDPQLRAEVESLLAYESDSPEILETGAVAAFRADDPLIGTTISHYSILEKLGEGGMGVVYKAEDTLLGRHVALKFLARDLVTTDQLRERFIREARTAAALDHANICTVYDVEEVDGKTFIVMAYVEGESLRETLSSGRLEPAQAVRIALQVAEGLEAAHAKEIVHRDIKPSNIMVTMSGGAKIMDFGLARSTTQAGLTETGMVMGTASYMSPEQARGEHVDPRTDIWSLGAVLYETVTGERPFKGASSEAVLYSILHEEPAAPSSIRDDVAEELEIIIANALEKEPDDRYQNVAELASDLTAVGELLRGAGESPALAEISRKRRAKEAARLRRRLGAAARRWWATVPVATAVVVAAVVGVRQMVGTLAETPLIPDRVVVAAFENRTGDESLDHLGLLVGEWMLEGVSEVGLGDVVPTVFVAGLSGRGDIGSDREREPGTRALAERAGAGLVISGTYHSLHDSIQFRANLTGMPGEKIVSTVTSGLTTREASFDAIEVFRQRIMGGLAIHLSPEIMLESYLAPPLFEAYAELCAGKVLCGKDYRGAAEHFARAIQLDSTFVEPYLELASAEFDLKDHAAGEAVLGVLNQRRATLTPVQRCALDFMLAKVQGRQREAWRHVMEAARIAPRSDYVKSAVLWEARQMNRPRMAIEVGEEMGGPGNLLRHGIKAVWWYANLADALHQEGEYQRELDVAREARERFPDVVHPRVVEARALAAMGRIDEVNQVLRECPITSPTWWFTFGHLLPLTARELRAHGYTEAAQEIASRAVEWCQKRRFEVYPGQDARTRLALALYVAERWQEAQEVYEELAREYPNSVFYLGATGRTAARLGDRDEALRVFDELQALDRPYLLGEHNYASAQIASILGDYEQAVVLLAKAFDQTKEYSSPVLNDPDLLLMRGYPGWEELIRPKG